MYLNFTNLSVRVQGINQYLKCHDDCCKWTCVITYLLITQVALLTIVKPESCLLLLTALILAYCATSFLGAQKGSNPESQLYVYLVNSSLVMQ